MRLIRFGEKMKKDVNRDSRRVGASERRSSSRPLRTAGTVAAVVAAAGLALMGCGGSSGTSTAKVAPAGGSGGASAASGTSKAERFSACMRAHGEPQFPDPSAQGSFSLPAGMSTSSPQFQAAQQACKSLAPPGPLNGHSVNQANLAKTLKFVACMRSHGVATFPDPNPQGKLQGGGSVPINSPQFFSAYRTCRALLPPGAGFGAGG
jgi:hypothetical protein